MRRERGRLMGQEVILVDRERRTWFDFGKRLEAAKSSRDQNPGSELVYDDAYDDWWDWQWDELTFRGCVYGSHDRCRHGAIPDVGDWPLVTEDLATPAGVIQRGIEDGHIDEEALEAINLEVKVTF